MNWQDGIIADIGKGMGIDGLHFGESGVISIGFEGGKTVFVEKQEEGVLVYLLQSLPHFDRCRHLTDALGLCHYTRSLTYPLQLGLKNDDTLLWLIYLDNRQFTRPDIEAAINSLLEYNAQADTN